MARKSVNELLAQVASSFPDNATGLITPALMRAMFNDFLNSFSPAYGTLTRTTPNTQTLNTTPTIITFSAAYDSNSAETTSSTATNRVTRAEKGTSTINFSADFEAPNGRFITFTIYKDGVATPWRITGNGGGAGNPVAAALTAVDYADPAAYYDIHAVAEVDGVQTVLNNMALIVAIDPVRSFT